jgi:hypothetical protein
MEIIGSTTRNFDSTSLSLQIVVEVLKKHTTKDYTVEFIDDILIYSNIEEDNRPYVYAVI